MQYHVNRNGQELGIYSLDQIREGLRGGNFLPGDLAWTAGMAEWVPLSDLSGLRDRGDAGLFPASEIFTDTRAGPAWEDPRAGDWFTRACETLKAGASSPTAFFTNMRVTGGIAPPLIFYVLVGTALGAIGLLIEMVFELAGLGFGPFAAEGSPGEIIFTNVFAIFFLPLFIPIGAFIDAGVTHLMLMMLGGDRRPFETTFRVCSYSSAIVGLAAVVPFCGAIIALVWVIVLQIIGISIAHGISTGKAAAAVLLPTLVCCGGLLVFFMTLGFAFV